LISGIGGFLIYYTFSPNPSTVENIPSNNLNVSDSTTQMPTSQKPGRLKNKMVLIKGGTFEMGGNNVALDFDPFNHQYPAHMVEVPDFYIDRTEVSNEEYAEFIRDTKRKPPANWQSGKPAVGQEKFPVTNIFHSEATEFASWISKRDNARCQLPTEEQWEYAARGGALQNIYPWGIEWIPGGANIDFGSPREVGTTGDETSGTGVKDMMGNVMELTSSVFNYYEDFPEKEKNKIFDANVFTVRGASFAAAPIQIKNKHLLLTLRQRVEPNDKNNYIGFRLSCYP
jgi:formylglycine-generating enzyme required for sulfatase activity